MEKNAREALMAALRGLSSSSFKEFKEKLSTWDIPLEYERIPQNQLQKAGRTGVAILVTSFYGNEYGLSKAFHLIDTICLSQECKSITAKKHGRIFQGDIFPRKAIPNQQLEYGSKSGYLSPDKKPSEDSDWEEMTSLCPGPMTKVLKDNKDKSRVLHHRGTPASIQSVTPATSSGSKTQGKKPQGDMSDEHNRLDTYQGRHFPHNNQQSLSQAGFYYVGPGDRVRCFSCGGGLKKWKDWDVPLTRHLHSFPGCPYVRGLVTRKHYHVRPGLLAGESVTQVHPSSSNILWEEKPLSDMSDEYNRLETYRGHSNNFPHNNPLSLAWAGFYYVGPKGRVRCFSCGGELMKWQTGDEPLTRHRLSFPDCPYVLHKDDAMKDLKAYLQSHKFQTTAFSSSVTDYDNSEPVKRHFGKCTDPPVSSLSRDPPLRGCNKRGKKKKKKKKRVREKTAFEEIQAETAGGLTEEVARGLEDSSIGKLEERVTGELEVDFAEWLQGSSAEELEYSSLEELEDGSTGELEEGTVGKLEEHVIEQTKEPCDWSSRSVMECKLCGKVPDAIKVHTRKDGDKYRLELPYEGRFCCSETGIRFCVESPTSIEFEFGSWDEYLGHLEQYSYHIVSPLFDITIKCGWVSEVYLPHYVCLGGGHVVTEEFKVVHYKDDNMVLETPAEVLPFYVVLKQPTFSPIGILLLRKLPSRVRRNFPTHGAVFLYSRYITGYTLHLYFMPMDPSLKKALDKEEGENGFSWVAKPPKTSTVFSSRIYIVEGPDKAKIKPKGLRLSFGDCPALYHYSEIYLLNVDEELSLSLTCTTSQKGIWDALLRREDLTPRSQMERDGQHFINNHRADLIARVSLIDPVLDDLLGDKILTQEQYDTVRSNRTSQEKMRQLYEYVRSWGKIEMEMFYSTLTAHNKALIRDLLQ